VDGRVSGRKKGNWRLEMDEMESRKKKKSGPLQNLLNFTAWNGGGYMNINLAVD